MQCRDWLDIGVRMIRKSIKVTPFPTRLSEVQNESSGFASYEITLTQHKAHHPLEEPSRLVSIGEILSFGMRYGSRMDSVDTLQTSLYR